MRFVQNLGSTIWNDKPLKTAHVYYTSRKLYFQFDSKYSETYLLVAVCVHFIGAVVGHAMHRISMAEAAYLVCVVFVEYRSYEGKGELTIRKISFSFVIEFLNRAIINFFQVLLNVTSKIKKSRSWKEVIMRRKCLHRGSKVF